MTPSPLPIFRGAPAPGASCRLPGLVALALLLAGLPAATLAAEEAAPVPTEITARHLESVSTDREMTTIFTGDVVITGTNIRITCERVEVVSLRKGPKEQVLAKQNRFKSLLATGRVKIIQGDREATCGRAVVLPGENRITLSENPMVVDHSAGFTWIGDELFLLRGERRVHGNNVKIIGPEIKDLGFDKNQKLEFMKSGATAPNQKAAPAPPPAPPPQP